ncbi:MAG TPA: hypothetical protein VIQ22_02495 [Gammaproteobacteria bacterium]
MQKRLIPAFLVGAGVFVFLSGCGQKGVQEEAAASHNNEDYYEVHAEGRIHVFDDAPTYLSFLSVGETAFRKVRIGDGPKGETVVFGLTAEDKKKSEGIAGIDMFDGKLQGGEPFYGEIVNEGRINVFNNWQEMQVYKQTGEAAYRYTDIGSGPKGETVVYVLTKEEKKHRPDATIAKFRQMRSM